jgi:hypothetical protein
MKSVFAVVTVPLLLFVAGCSGSTTVLNDWPASEKIAFLDSCNAAANGQNDYCECTLTALQSAYSWTEISALSTEEDGMDEIQQLGVKECAWAID